MFFTFNTGSFLLFRGDSRETVARFFFAGCERYISFVSWHCFSQTQKKMINLEYLLNYSEELEKNEKFRDAPTM